jgi:serine/threonine-protein kinase
MNTNTLLKQGTILANKYSIIRELGSGGFGKTYLVTTTKNEQEKYVLKQFSPEQGQFNQKSLQLFEQEAKILDQLNHPQIPKLLEWFEDKGIFFIVQEYIEGDNYWQLLCQRKATYQTFTETEIIGWLEELLNIINYIHSKDIIHRDISPDNIIYSTTIQKPVLIDFGGVKQVTKTIINNNYDCSKGTKIGKIGYSAPEQLKTGECYPNSDIYALGVSALVLLTGREPDLLFNSYSGEKTWYQYIENEKLKSILDKMLAEYPKERYASAAEVLADLYNLNNSPLNPTEINQPQKTLVIESSLDLINQEEKLVSKDNNSVKKSYSLKQIILIFILCLLGGSTTILVIKIPHIQVICKKLDNCARDKEYQEIFDQILADSSKIIKSSEVKNIDDLKLQAKDLNNIIQRLKNIPEDVKVFSESTVQLTNYNDQLTQTNEKINRESQAQQKYQDLEKQIDNLKQQTTQANSIEKYQNLKSEWGKLQKKLNEFEPNLFISSKISSKLTESKDHIAQIDTIIKDLQAKASAQRIAAQKAQAQRIASQKSSTQSSPKTPISSPTTQTRYPSPVSKSSPKPTTRKTNPPTNNNPPQPTNVSRRGSVW